jgi:hypothetical protein
VQVEPLPQWPADAVHRDRQIAVEPPARPRRVLAEVDRHVHFQILDGHVQRRLAVDGLV